MGLAGNERSSHPDTKAAKNNDYLAVFQIAEPSADEDFRRGRDVVR